MTPSIGSDKVQYKVGWVFLLYFYYYFLLLSSLHQGKNTALS